MYVLTWWNFDIMTIDSVWVIRSLSHLYWGTKIRWHNFCFYKKRIIPILLEHKSAKIQEILVWQNIHKSCFLLHTLVISANSLKVAKTVQTKLIRSTMISLFSMCSWFSNILSTFNLHMESSLLVENIFTAPSSQVVNYNRN